ncbi:MAG: hypothetical protein A2V67_09205 [Deltaproteobacteria bacterium RBG_13_61_14]|nr:MAG: hypothetical protein A2V67_09205 [Deltaproteobacteria bacterium RBG_13_61_14]
MLLSKSLLKKQFDSCDQMKQSILVIPWRSLLNALCRAQEVIKSIFEEIKLYSIRHAVVPLLA